MPNYTLDITSCGSKDNKVRDIIVLFPKKGAQFALDKIAKLWQNNKK